MQAVVVHCVDNQHRRKDQSTFFPEQPTNSCIDNVQLIKQQGRKQNKTIKKQQKKKQRVCVGVGVSEPDVYVCVHSIVCTGSFFLLSGSHKK